MKKSILKTIALLTSFAIIACSQDIVIENTQNRNDGDAINKICITGKNFQIDDDTRSSVTIGESGASFAWDEDDVIGIFPDKGDQVSFAMEQGAGTQTATFSGGGWALKSSAKYAAYYPHVYENRDMTAIPVSYLGQTQNGNGNTDHIGAYDFMAAGVSTPENGAVAFDMQHLGCLVQIQIIVPEAGTMLNYITLYTEYVASFTEAGYIDLSQDSPSITSERRTSAIALKLDKITTSKDSETVIAYMMIAPTDLTESEFTISINYDTSNSSNRLYSCSVPNKNMKAGKAYSFTIEMPSPYYRTVTMTEAGTLSSILLDDTETIQTLKISGPINGDDIRLLRHMAGVNLLNENFASQLTTLDLRDARIVEGGDYYATMEKWAGSNELGDDYYFYTKNDVFGPFMFCYSNLAEIKLPSTITEMGNLALFDCNSLTKLTIPETVETMGVAVLMHCDNITEVILPQNLQIMKESMFRACFSLKEIPVWPSNITEIPFATFAACNSFMEISIPNNIKKIGDNAFWDCVGMKRIDIPASVTSIGNGVFRGCKSLEKLVCYPITPPTLGSDAFYSTPSLYVPYDCRDLYKYANGWYNYYKNSYINAIEWGI